MNGNASTRVVARGIVQAAHETRTHGRLYQSWSMVNVAYEPKRVISYRTILYFYMWVGIAYTTEADDDDG